MTLQLQDAQRHEVRMRIGMSGASGSGKTYSALKLARGMVGSWDKIAVIDTENRSAALYENLVPKGEKKFKVLNLSAPYSPARYVEAIKICEDAGIELIIIDSTTHEWDGEGGCLDIQNKLGGRYQDWAKVTPMHQAFVNKILQSKCHIITTTRRKQDYDMSKDSSGKMTVTKVGLKEIQREGFEYELTLTFDIDINHFAKAGKDRTGLFSDVPEFKITEETGKTIKKWNESGAELEEIKEEIIEAVEISDPAPDHLIEKLKKKAKTLEELNKKCGTNFKAWNHIPAKQAPQLILKCM